jgi:hypothetical protein
MSKTTIPTGGITADAIDSTLIADDAVSEEHLDATAITGSTELAETPADTDEILISDAGTLKRIDFSHINNLTNQAIIKGWVNFDGTGTVAISQSYNCSSITDSATGRYTVNWSAATGATGANSAPAGGGDRGGYNNDERVMIYASGNNQTGVESWDGTTATDFDTLNILVFGNGS